MNNTIEYQEYPKTNREYKSTLFVMAFDKKADLLELLNAVNGTNYDDPDALEITTLENAIYLTYKNDVAFLFGGTMNLYEHQSTYNPNMPVRGLLYFARLYEKFINQKNLDIYSSVIQKLPTPRYVVFYNGTGEQPDRTTIRLSDAFIHEDGCLECEATMLNINYGRNKELMEKCKPLRDYAILIDKIKRYTAEKKSIEEAVNQAVDECIKEDVLADFLRKHRAEVMDVCITEYNEERVLDAIREESYMEGREEGIRNTLQTILNLGLDIQTAVTKTAESYQETEEKIWDIWETS